jgi:hypothetical protein
MRYHKSAVCHERNCDGFSENTFSRIVNYDATGWIGSNIGGPLDYLEDTIWTTKNKTKSE